MKTKYKRQCNKSWITNNNNNFFELNSPYFNGEGTITHKQPKKAKYTIFFSNNLNSGRIEGKIDVCGDVNHIKNVKMFLRCVHKDTKMERIKYIKKS